MIDLENFEPLNLIDKNSHIQTFNIVKFCKKEVLKAITDYIMKKVLIIYYKNKISYVRSEINSFIRRVWAILNSKRARRKTTRNTNDGNLIAKHWKYC